MDALTPIPRVVPTSLLQLVEPLVPRNHVALRDLRVFRRAEVRA